MQQRGVVLAVVLLAAAACCQAYYLPGTYPQEFRKGDIIQGEQERGRGRVLP